MKQIFIDVETTGLYANKHGIIQLAGRVYKNGEHQEDFNFQMQPMESDQIEKRALQVNGITEEEIAEFESGPVVFARFKKLLTNYLDPFDKTDKAHFIAYNAPLRS